MEIPVKASRTQKRRKCDTLEPWKRFHNLPIEIYKRTSYCIWDKSVSRVSSFIPINFNKI